MANLPAAPLLTSTKKSYIDPAHLPRVEGATLRRILAHLRPYRRDGLSVFVLILVGAALNLTPPILVRHVIDEAIPARDLRLLFSSCALMVLLPLIAGVAGVYQKYLTSRIGERVMLDFRIELFENLQRQPHTYFVNARPGEALSSVLNDVQGIGAVMSTTLLNIVEGLVVLGMASVVVVALDWRLALVALAILPVFVLPGKRVGRRRKELRRAAQAKMAELTGVLDESLSAAGSLLVKVFGAERLEAQRLREKAEALLELNLRQTLVGRWFQMFVSVFESFGLALVFGVGGYLILDGDLALGTVVAFVTLLRRLYPPAAALAGMQVDVLTSYAYFERVFKMLDLRPGIISGPNALILPSAAGHLRFEGVCFAFPGGEGLLRDIDFEVRPGECVALVGPSGAGKSTLAFLVPRLLDPSEGRVLFDGHDLRALEIGSLRSHVAIVTQDTYLFYGTIRENLRYGRPLASNAQLEEAARAANIHDLIEALPEGYETLVGRAGYRLAGGERQRLSIARAVLKDPRVLILDEATSSVDTHSEVLIQAALEPLLRGRTSLVIAHRLSTVRRADLIAVIAEGRIVERGSHETLLRCPGLYAELVRDQFRGVAPTVETVR